MMFGLRLATIDDLPMLLPLVKAYHQFEGINLTDTGRENAITALLSNSSLGYIWLVTIDNQNIGYIALTLGYSIEFGGKDAFIDEFYIEPEFRGRGLGQQTLKAIQQEARLYKIRAIHLEVAHTNKEAQRTYTQANFQARNKYMLMSVHLDNSQ
ncbi:MAG: GNAT family N-acetyltransferase [Leptolyngbya sp. SIO3F4]|nr:GNAT family N-acetyltransferase [Leptolyngbya sp. SIO3F4]